MKRLIIGGLSALLLTATSTPAVRAQTTATNSATLNSSSTSQLTPFNVFFLANRGYLKAQGIPSYNSLIAAYSQGRITAKDIVAAAVRANRLSPKYLTDQSYISAVESQLRETQSTRIQ